MRIVIDMQGAQTESRFRGIGRYTLSFVQAVLRNKGDHEVVLALSGLFPETIEPIREAFEGLLPQDDIRVWYSPGPISECVPGNESRHRAAELLREAFLASLNPDIIHISSLFEGFSSNAVQSIDCFDHSTPVSVSLYDLIPLLNPDHYLSPNPAYARYYRQKIDHLERADVCLAISDFARQEGIQHLRRSEDSLVNVSTAISPDFRKIEVDPATADSILSKFNIRRPFLLYTGGADERKNLPRLVEAFALIPAHLRMDHQLVFSGKMPEMNVEDLRRQAGSAGVKPENLCFTGYVTDPELIILYNLCRLYVFPSWHEGFGLPALEAMACGAPVIGANSSSLPEVIAFEPAMFDPFDVKSISRKISQALEDEAFRDQLSAHGLRQARNFSWDITARRAIQTWESVHESKCLKPSAPLPVPRPRLAFVSPMPPERTGIADYSADLLPALAKYYDIELIVAQEQVTEPLAGDHFPLRDTDWLRANADRVDRVLYQMGNSSFHQHMLALIEEIPGTVVMHDFYLSGLIHWMEDEADHKDELARALYLSHGYLALRERYRDVGAANLIYPANFSVIRNAQGVIVHSDYSKKLAQDWYSEAHSNALQVIPLVRRPAEHIDKLQARNQLGLGENDFIVCSFGFLDVTKLNHRMLDSWLGSELADNPASKLVFIGHSSDDEYGRALRSTIELSGFGDRIHITGFASQDQFRQYLMAADVAVQLRGSSRGETSAAVLDCMGHGLPVIVNANGAMAELDEQAAFILPDQFENADLTAALEALWQSPEQREVLGKRARKIITSRHAPDACARLYAETIERFHQKAATGADNLIRALAAQNPQLPDSVLIPLSECAAASLPLPRPARSLFLDVTATCRNDLKTGIERVARSIVMALLEICPAGYRIEPVYLSHVSGRWHYRYASCYMRELLGCPPEALADENVEPETGDILLGLDLSGDTLVQAEQAGLFANYRNRGVAVYFTIFDLLPVQMPEMFPSGADRTHADWLRAVTRFDGAICISETVAREFADWQQSTGLSRKSGRPFRVSWFHLGADVVNSAPSRGLLPDSEQTLAQLSARPTFLMVGTIEPRKGHLKTLQAFERLWSRGLDVNLVIVGHEGWQTLPDWERTQIARVAGKLEAHPERGKRLFWLQGVSDEYLENIYAASTCLIAASYGEGFGLPLIEAAKHKLAIIARDIPVFREVAGSSACFYRADADLAGAIEGWLADYDTDHHPLSDAMTWLTWQESALQLAEILFNDKK